MPVYYTAVRRFDPTHGAAWSGYVEWSSLFHLREVVSLDAILCSSVFDDVTDEDWKHNVHEDCKTHLFYDLDYVVSRVRGDDTKTILAVMQNPTQPEVSSFADTRFTFRGFDLIELGSGVSALVNCGGFDKVFAASDLSDCGLVTDLGTALRFQRQLRLEYPDVPDANCDVWAIWQMTLS